jgi:hypothetical protein
MPKLALVIALLPLATLAQNTRVVPADGVLVWAKPDHFWFRKAIAGTHVWLTVDAEHGAKEPLFDHQRLAIELSLRTGDEYEPNTLPFADPAAEFVVKYDGSNAYIQEGAKAIEFVLGDGFWRCDLQIKWNWNLVPPTDYECLRRRAATPGRGGIPPPAPVTSPDGRWQAVIHEHNVAIRPAGQAPATPRVLSADGTAEYSYQLGSIQWERDSQALTAWRVHRQVWTTDSVTANVKPLVAKGRWTVR